MQLVVGQIVRPHGVHGELVVDVRTDEPELRYAVGSVLATDPAVAGPLTVESARPHHGRLLVGFQGVADRDVAEHLRGVLLCVDSETLPPPADPEEFHDFQLVGLWAQTPSGDPIGEVVRVEHAPASDLLVIRLADGRTGMVPFVGAMVPEVDLAGGRIVLTPPDGIFSL
jgi:16S rRNA processing protein RimM